MATAPGFFSKVVVTGSHARSIAALLSGRIDVAAVDAVTLALLRDRHSRRAADVRIVEWTPASPALPLVTAISTPAWIVAALREGVQALAGAPAAHEDLRSLRIAGFTIVGIDGYASRLTFKEQARAAGYPVLN